MGTVCGQSMWVPLLLCSPGLQVLGCHEIVSMHHDTPTVDRLLGPGG